MKTLWASRYVMLMLLVPVVLIAVVTSNSWFLLIPVFLLLMSWSGYHFRRSRSLKRKGFFFTWGSSGASSYEEATGDGSRKVLIPSSWTENGRAELFIPTRSDWERAAPDWAAQRRDEIFQRVVSVWNGFEIHYPGDWGELSDPKIVDAKSL